MTSIIATINFNEGTNNWPEIFENRSGSYNDF